MAAFIHGTFKDNNNIPITVEIHSSHGSGDITIGSASESSEIYFGAEPVIISAECEDMFEHIIKRTCKINIVTSIYLGDILFAGNEKDVEVKIYKDTNCIFSGYVEPYTYTQPLAYTLEELTLNCMDKLCCLQYEYFLDDKTWQEKREMNNVLSFKDYLSLILPTSTYWDKSKQVDDKDLLDVAGVSMNVFLGKSQKDVWSNEAILEEILRYCNLHAMQDGDRIFLFDWNSIGSTSSWYNIYDNSVILIETGTIPITQNILASDDTNMSMSDVYNQIVLKCELEDKDDLLESPIESEEITAIVDKKQLWYSEYVLDDYLPGAKSQTQSFQNIVKQGYSHPETITDSGAKWYRQDWYFKWMSHPSWKIMYNGKPISDWIEYDSQTGEVINTWRILRAMQENRFMPALIWAGKNENKISKQRTTRLNSNGEPTGNISGKNYLVISVNGNYDDSELELTNIDNAIYKSSHDAQGNTTGLLSFSEESGIYSPADDETTNYIIFNGSLTLVPVKKCFGTISPDEVWPAPYRTMAESNSLAVASSGTHVGSLYLIPVTEDLTQSVSNDSKNHLLAQQMWTARDPGTIEQPANTMTMVYPPTDLKETAFTYKYTDCGDETDRIDKLSILECELKIGDKYLVEVETGDAQKPDYQWLTYENCPEYSGIKKTTFSIGIDPTIGEPIIGKEYELANTVNGRYSNEKGTAIPIKKSDGLTGALSFKIIGIYNQQWNNVTRRHHTMFRHTKYYNNWKNLWSWVSSIWIKDFNIKIISDNKGFDNSTKAQDLCYISDEAEGYIKKRDDITFKINTMPTTDELLEIGIKSNVSNTNVVNMITKEPLGDIEDNASNETDRAERLYINEYWNMYHAPKALIETTISTQERYVMHQKWSLVGFGAMIPYSANYDIKKSEVTLRLRQI